MVAIRTDGSATGKTRPAEPEARGVLRHASVPELRSFVSTVLRTAGVEAATISEVMRCSTRTARRDRSGRPAAILDAFRQTA